MRAELLRRAGGGHARTLREPQMKAIKQRHIICGVDEDLTELPVNLQQLIRHLWPSVREAPMKVAAVAQGAAKMRIQMARSRQRGLSSI